MNEDIKNYLTVSEAVEQGYASSSSAISSQIRRGVLPAKIVGKTYLIHKDDLEDMLKRRDLWQKNLGKRTENYAKE